MQLPLTHFAGYGASMGCPGAAHCPQMPRDKSKRRDGGPTSGAVARAVGARCRVQTHGYLTAIP